MDLCRTCMNSRGNDAAGDNFYSIFSVVDDVYIAERLTQWVGYTIEEDDGLPSEVCLPCVEAIKYIAQFVENAKECDRKFRGELKMGSKLDKPTIWVDYANHQNDGVGIETLDEVDIKYGMPPSELIDMVIEPLNVEYIEDPVKTDVSSESEESNTDKRKRKVSKRRKRQKRLAKNQSLSDENTLPEDEGSPSSKSLAVEENVDELDEVELETFNAIDVGDKVVCCGCLRLFDTMEDLEKHGKNVHQVIKQKKINHSKTVTCKYCFKRFGRNALCQNHRKPYTTLKRVYECRRCRKRFINPATRRNHAHNHIPIDIPIPKFFTVPMTRLKKHGFLCCVRGCTSSQKSEDDLFEHIKKDHKNIKIDLTVDLFAKPVECVFCHRNFESEEKLAGHQIHRYCHANGIRFTHQCHKCGKICQSAEQLTAHENRHTGDKPYECDICLKRYFSPAVLRQHRLTHTLDKSLSCTICGMTFRMKSFLENHYRIHSSEKPFDCNLCGKTFRHKSSLFSHKKIHDPENYEKCSVCGKAFADPTNLKRHMVSHTGVKPYGCDYCDKRFMRLNERAEHISLTHEGVMPYSCEICGVTFTNKRAYQKHEHTV
ncbi:zinc finger protein 184-like [Topomyia yanbarensis]|uniref:zinc finger protein 184-like n=1 Tax=Topomyia yanbarensis TaxID=2498891 RepID=UPI00273AC349|nr:zinc finger protein 184-like [Topomyia yanbarensis]